MSKFICRISLSKLSVLCSWILLFSQDKYKFICWSILSFQFLLKQNRQLDLHEMETDHILFHILFHFWYNTVISHIKSKMQYSALVIYVSWAMQLASTVKRLMKTTDSQSETTYCIIWLGTLGMGTSGMYGRGIFITKINASCLCIASL